jgi:Zn-dependent protease
METTVALVIGLLVALTMVPRVYAWLRVLEFRFRPPTVEITEPDSFPEILRPVFEAMGRTLGALGFEYSHAQWTDGMMMNEMRRPYLVFVHPETNTYAQAMPSAFENGARVFDVAFTTAYQSGAVVATFDSLEHLAFSFPPDWECHDHYLNDVASQWEAHLQAIAGRPTEDVPVQLHPDEFAAREEQALSHTLDHLEYSGDMRQAEALETWRMNPAAAWRFATSVLKGTRRVAHATARREHPFSASDEPAKIAADAFAYEQFEAAERARQRSTHGKLLWFCLSAAGFVLVFGWLFSWRMVPLLLAVVFIHELGHLIGMKIFGYRDRRILFVPFLGGAAVGRKDDATALERVIVLLLGPAPGLAFGLVYLVLYLYVAPSWLLSAPSWLFELAVLALVLNYLNLLPFAPLDGGRIIETLFLGRMPLAQALLLALSAGLFGAGAILLEDPILGVFAVLTAIAIPTKWRWGRVARALAKRVPPNAERPRKVRAVFRTLSQAAFSSASRARRFLLARSVLEHLESRAPSAVMRIGGAAVYGALLLAPVGAYGWLVSGRVMPSLFRGAELPTEWALTPAELRELPDDRVEGAVVEQMVMLLASYQGDWARLRDEVPSGALTVYSTWLLEAEVTNGGFLQYFWNVDRASAQEALASLQTIEARKHAALMQKAISVDSIERPGREMLMENGGWDAFFLATERTQFGELDEEFNRLDQTLAPLRVRFIRENPETFLLDEP